MTQPTRDPQSATRNRMRAAVLYGPEDVRLEDIPVPEIGPGDVLVKIGAATTCGTDAKVFLRGGHPTMIRPPAPFGHEFAGTVEAVGAAVAGFEPGMRVVAANSAPCQQCRYCKMGRWSLCKDILYINGAYAEYIAVPERIVKQNLLHLADHVPLRARAWSSRWRAWSTAWPSRASAWETPSS